MKKFFLALCGCLLVAPICPAQQPADSPPPLLFVYVAKYNDGILPRISLGLEKPTLKLQGFEKCVTLSRANPNYGGLAVQLKADDAKVLVAAIKSQAAPDAKDLPAVLLWFATPDNQALGYIETNNPPANEANLVKSSILYFGSDSEKTIVSYLMEKLHPQ